MAARDDINLTKGKPGCPVRIRTSINGVRVRSLTFRRRGNRPGASKHRKSSGQGLPQAACGMGDRITAIIEENAASVAGIGQRNPTLAVPSAFPPPPCPMEPPALASRQAPAARIGRDGTEHKRVKRWGMAPPECPAAGMQAPPALDLPCRRNDRRVRVGLSRVIMPRSIWAPIIAAC